MSVFDLLLEPLKPFLAFDKIKVDNVVFALHTKATTLFLVGASLIVTAEMFIGDPIQCHGDGEVVDDTLLDTYCWIHSTFVISNQTVEVSLLNLLFTL